MKRMQIFQTLVVTVLLLVLALGLVQGFLVTALPSSSSAISIQFFQTVNASRSDNLLSGEKAPVFWRLESSDPSITSASVYAFITTPFTNLSHSEEYLALLNASQQPVDGSGFHFWFNTTTLSNGFPYNFTVVAVDAQGKIISNSFLFGVYNNGTVVAVDAVTNPAGTTLTAPHNVTWTTVAGADVKDISIYIRDRTPTGQESFGWKLLQQGSNDGSYNLDPAPLANGRYQLALIAETSAKPAFFITDDFNVDHGASTDSQGYCTGHDAENVGYGSYCPVASITSPGLLATVSKMVTVAWQAWDNRDPVTVLVDYSNDRATWHTLANTTGNGTVTWNTTDLPDGNYTLRATTMDLQFNRAENLSVVVVDNEHPTLITFNSRSIQSRNTVLTKHAPIPWELSDGDAEDTHATTYAALFTPFTNLSNPATYDVVLNGFLQGIGSGTEYTYYLDTTQWSNGYPYNFTVYVQSPKGEVFSEGFLFGIYNPESPVLGLDNASNPEGKNITGSLRLNWTTLLSSSASSTTTTSISIYTHQHDGASTVSSFPFTSVSSLAIPNWKLVVGGIPNTGAYAIDTTTLVNGVYDFTIVLEEADKHSFYGIPNVGVFNPAASPSGNGGNGGGGGGGGGGSTTTVPPTEQQQVCTESWICTWGVCSADGVETATLCVDTNHCGTTISKPSRRTCTPEIVYAPISEPQKQNPALESQQAASSAALSSGQTPQVAKPRGLRALTGAVIAPLRKSPVIASLIILALVLVGIAAFFFLKPKKPSVDVAEKKVKIIKMSEFKKKQEHKETSDTAASDLEEM
ncbi:Ig-like domain-containing protein [Candidatus Woesearchaeota archaeon]|nr:Ig-like domain-containing protein [Candidatus Woesearchaeota archaeon]